MLKIARKELAQQSAIEKPLLVTNSKENKDRNLN